MQKKEENNLCYAMPFETPDLTPLPVQFESQRQKNKKFPPKLQQKTFSHHAAMAFQSSQ